MYSGYGTAFDGTGLWSFGYDFARNVVTYAVVNNSLSHSDNLKNVFLVLGEGPTDNINGSIGATEQKFKMKKLRLSLHYNSDKVKATYFFVVRAIIRITLGQWVSKIIILILHVRVSTSKILVIIRSLFPMIQQIQVHWIFVFYPFFCNLKEKYHIRREIKSKKSVYMWIYFFINLFFLIFIILFNLPKIRVGWAHLPLPNSYLLDNGKKIYKLNVDNENVYFPTQFYLGNISKNFDVPKSGEVSLKENVNDLSVDYNAIDKSNILNIHKYLIVKNNIKWPLDLFLKTFTRLVSVYTIENFGELLAFNSEGCLKYASLNNRPCQARSTLVNINSNQPLYYPFTVTVNKCGGVFNTIIGPYAWVCGPNKVKNMNVKIFNVEGKWNKIISSAWIRWV